MTHWGEPIAPALLGAGLAPHPQQQEAGDGRITADKQTSWQEKALPCVRDAQKPALQLAKYGAAAAIAAGRVGNKHGND